MARGDEPAAPVEIENRCSAKGMTIREVIANEQMAALIGRVPLGELKPSDQKSLGEQACELADALLAALAKEADAK